MWRLGVSLGGFLLLAFLHSYALIPQSIQIILLIMWCLWILSLDWHWSITVTLKRRQVSVHDELSETLEAIRNLPEKGV